MWPRRGLRVATSPAFRGRSIGRADGPDRPILGRFTKNPLKFSEINPHSRRPLRIFYKKRLVLFSNQRSVQNGWALVCLQKRPPLYRKSNRAPQTLSPFFAKTSSDFSQIKIQPNFDYIFFFSKTYVWPVDRAHGRARKTSKHIIFPPLHIQSDKVEILARVGRDNMQIKPANTYSLRSKL